MDTLKSNLTSLKLKIYIEIKASVHGTNNELARARMNLMKDLRKSSNKAQRDKEM